MKWMVSKKFILQALYLMIYHLDSALQYQTANVYQVNKIKKKKKKSF